jgi:hypothetical protein
MKSDRKTCRHRREKETKNYIELKHIISIAFLLVNSCFVFSTCFNERLLLLFQKWRDALIISNTHTHLEIEQIHRESYIFFLNEVFIINDRLGYFSNK